MGSMMAKVAYADIMSDTIKVVKEKAKICFLGFLLNADQSLDGLSLNGFRIKKMDTEGLIQFLSDLDMKERGEIINDYWHNRDVIDPREEFTMVISNQTEFEYEVHIGNNRIHHELPHDLFGSIHDSADEAVNSIKLFKDGDIILKESIFYFKGKHSGNSVMRVIEPRKIYPGMLAYSLSTIERKQLNKLLKHLAGCKDDSIRLAISLFQMSYEMPYRGDFNMAFLSLMIGLESLLTGEGNGELRYRLSRSVAVLLGETKKESYEIMKQVKKYYDIRSTIVHSGKPGYASKDDLAGLRQVVRRVITAMLVTGESRDHVLIRITENGFGVAPLRFDSME